MNYRYCIACLVALVIFSACASKSDDGGEDNEQAGNGSEQEVDPAAFAAECGMVQEGILTSTPGTAEPVTARAFDTDLIAATRLSGPFQGSQQLVKLHGITAQGGSPQARERGMAWINSALSTPGFLVPAGVDCPVVMDNGGQGILGQIFTADGESVSEVMLRERAAFPVDEACGAELLQSCYETLIPRVSADVITNFLWKPEAERDGNLVVLVSPYDATVVVRGAITETLVNGGPSNGRGTTARASSPGCAYGDQVRVEVFDAEGLQIYTNSGADHIVVPSGCDRTEYSY